MVGLLHGSQDRNWDQSLDRGIRIKFVRSDSGRFQSDLADFADHDFITRLKLVGENIFNMKILNCSCYEGSVQDFVRRKGE